MEETAGEDREKSEVEPSTFLPADITEVSDPVEAGLPDIKQEGKIWVTYDMTGRQIEIPENLAGLTTYMDCMSYYLGIEDGYWYQENCEGV